jgi:hypothetical protein
LLTGAAPLTVPSGTPTWLSGATDLAWLAPSGNKISGVLDALANTTNAGTGGPTMIFDAWGGFSYGRYIVAAGQGGHADYEGNEIYVWDTLADSPQWSLLKTATASSGTGNVPEWPDGRPSSDHGYITTIEADGRHFKWGLCAHNYIAGASSTVWEIDTTTWDYVSKGGSYTITGSGGGAACYDSVDGNIVYVRGNNAQPSVILTPLSTLVEGTTVTSDINVGSYISAAVDTVNHYLIVWTNSTSIYVMDLDNTGAGFSVITPSGQPSGNNENRWSWHVDGFIMYNGTLNKLTPDNASWTAATYSTVSTTGTAPANHTGAGIRGRQGIVDVAGKKVLFVNANYATTHDTHALPLTDSGV